MQNAIVSDRARPHQNRNDVAVTTRAFGIRNSIVLSTTSIVAMEVVSVAAVIFTASDDERVSFLTLR
jgi:hypothetical protein